MELSNNGKEVIIYILIFFIFTKILSYKYLYNISQFIILIYNKKYENLFN